MRSSGSSRGPGGGRLVAVPLSGFMYPREGTNRLALGIDSTRLAELVTFDPARWQQINDPRYVAQIERYFVTAFPPSAVALFEQLDTNGDGFLSRAELAPMQMAGSDRYAIQASEGRRPLSVRTIATGDGFLSPNRSRGGAASRTRKYVRALRHQPGRLFSAWPRRRRCSTPSAWRSVRHDVHDLDRGSRTGS